MDIGDSDSGGATPMEDPLADQRDGTAHFIHGNFKVLSIVSRCLSNTGSIGAVLMNFDRLILPNLIQLTFRASL